ncbi:hypothetical protein ACXZ1K_16040 [Pedobacter sp. PWIIR3]
MKKKSVFYSLAILLVAIGVTVLARQINVPHQASFAGEWKSKESISMGGNIVCTYNEGDRMLSNTMKITEQDNSVTIEVPNSSADSVLTTNLEKLTFDGKVSKINHGKGRGKTFTGKLSPDGKTITIKSVVRLMVATPYKVNELKPLIVNVTEVWNLSNDGKSIIVLADAKVDGDRRSWKTVFYKVG